MLAATAVAQAQCAGPRQAAPTASSLRSSAAAAPPPPQQQQQQRRRLQRCGGRRAAPPAAAAAAAAAAPSAAPAAEDKWIERALEAIVPDSASLPQPLAKLQGSCLSALATARMPTNRNEEYRFTDIKPLLQHSLAAPPAAGPSTAAAVAAAVAARPLKQAAAATVVVVDGVMDAQHSSMAGLPAGVYVGGLAGAPQDVVSFALGAQSRSRGGPFATLNGAAAREAVVIHIPANTTVQEPIHVLYLASSGSAAAPPAAAPRLLCVLEEGATAEVVEEFAPLAGGPAAAAAPAEGEATASPSAYSYLTAAVAEIELDDGAALKHSYVQLEAASGAHMRATLVNQGKASSYTLTEACVGGALARHDLSIQQLGEATQSQLRSFLLCGDGQLHDLHSKLILDHPNGEASQLHKCIVSAASGKGVFDGSVKVNRLAQKTDAQQLSRNLLLVPRATVNVKPNLQIVADDVKCTHGCTVSDLEEEELFYLRARGISAEMARQMLVYSFGREVVQALRDDALQGRVEAAVTATLAGFVSAAVAP